MPAPDTLVVLRPGDRVLVTLHDEPTKSENEDLVRSLRRAFPGVDFTLITGVSGLAVAAPTPEGS